MLVDTTVRSPHVLRRPLFCFAVRWTDVMSGCKYDLFFTLTYLDDVRGCTVRSVRSFPAIAMNYDFEVRTYEHSLPRRTSLIHSLTLGEQVVRI
jgi:hypothetical protein